MVAVGSDADGIKSITIELPHFGHMNAVLSGFKFNGNNTMKFLKFNNVNTRKTLFLICTTQPKLNFKEVTSRSN